MLVPAKKDIKSQAYQGSAADPYGLPLPEEANRQRQNNDSGEDQIYNEDEIPGVPVVKKG